ncbi:P1 family peptidase [Microbaculum marinum]|uniref:P1 family peptidase n=1 Tax=Microbaculum marinum TaxID=1764581 RepID=A0AAW9RYV5_9HYPH
MNPGPKNLLTDVPGLSVGHADDDALMSGTTVILCDQATVASVDVRGGGPGTRDTELLAPEMTVPGVDAIVISGGSAYGLDAASGVQAWLRDKGRGFPVGPVTVPIVPQAILFDLINGGNKDWGKFPPYRDFGWAACDAAGQDFAIGSVGAGLGCTTASLRGGLGSASMVTEDGFTVGAIVAVNCVGRVAMGDGPHFWAGAWEVGDEYGGYGLPPRASDEALIPYSKLDALSATTPALVATDAVLTKAEAKRLAVMAQDGMPRAIHPVHTPLDGDTVFSLATGKREMTDPVVDMMRIGAAAARCLARAISRAVYEAGQDGRGPQKWPAYRDRFPR